MAGRLNVSRLRWRRAATGAAWLAAALLLHLAVGGAISSTIDGWAAVAAMPPRLEAMFVRELTATVVPPPAVHAVRPAPRPAQRAAPAADAASAPQAPGPPAASALAEEAPEAPVDNAAQQMAAADNTNAGQTPAAEAPSDAASAPASTPPFEWPASTRLSYVLTGYFRGEMRGSAQVEWLRSGERYQVHLDVTVGPSFAPLMTRRMSSDGVLSEQGLSPRRYDEETFRAFSATRRLTMRFEADHVVMADGRRRPTLAGVQDTASQFVHLTWLFTTQPERLRPGQSVEVPLALPRDVDSWVYDVVARETLQAPFGAVEAFHLKPRRPARPGTLAVESWIAPTLQYLPVRIRIQQDAETFIDLMIEKPPLQAAEPAREPPVPGGVGRSALPASTQEEHP
jgi:hypothetical protein